MISIISNMVKIWTEVSYDCQFVKYHISSNPVIFSFACVWNVFTFLIMMPCVHCHHLSSKFIIKTIKYQANIIRVPAITDKSSLTANINGVSPAQLSHILHAIGDRSVASGHTPIASEKMCLYAHICECVWPCGRQQHRLKGTEVIELSVSSISHLAVCGVHKWNVRIWISRQDCVLVCLCISMRAGGQLRGSSFTTVTEQHSIHLCYLPASFPSTFVLSYRRTGQGVSVNELSPPAPKFDFLFFTLIAQLPEYTCTIYHWLGVWIEVVI